MGILQARILEWVAVSFSTQKTNVYLTLIKLHLLRINQLCECLSSGQINKRYNKPLPKYHLSFFSGYRKSKTDYHFLDYILNNTKLSHSILDSDTNPIDKLLKYIIEMQFCKILHLSLLFTQISPVLHTDTRFLSGQTWVMMNMFLWDIERLGPGTPPVEFAPGQMSPRATDPKKLRDEKCWQACAVGVN